MGNFTPDTVVRIPTSLDGKFFRYWLEFLSPLHNLTVREIDVFSSFLKKHFELSKKISDDDILFKVLFGEDIRKEIAKEYELSPAHFMVIMTNLRKKGLIVDNKINKRFIPVIKEGGKGFKLMLYFELDDKTINKESN